MKHGQIVMLKRKKGAHQAEVIRDHTRDNPPFNAITVKYRGGEWIVKPEELMTLEEYEKEQEAKETIRVGGMVKGPR